MSIIDRNVPPPQEAWDTLREWSRQSWWKRYRMSLLVMLPVTTMMMLIAGVAMLFAEFSWRSVALVASLWVIGVPLTALGYMRRVSRSAALVPPITPASLDPTTAVDMRGQRPDGRDI